MKLPETLNNDIRYKWHNWSDEDFIGTWDSKSTLIKAGETREFPMYLAFHFTKHFVDREMMKDILKNKQSEQTLTSDNLRAPYEAKTMSAIEDSVPSTAIESLKQEMKGEVKSPIEASEVKSEEFAGLRK